ncbi:MAG: class I SAM-dependent methyltransferase [Bacteroidetes bacterium]|nr:class I SAM-dependent methyltransferase [Bacteroidota bacterium]
MTGSSAFWDERFGQVAYVYGETPNRYFKSKLGSIKSGKILLPCEGEGRNAVYAATLGWEVHAFDQSIEGKKKAENLAKRHNAKIDYVISDIENIAYPAESFDALALIFAHFPSSIRKELHRTLSGYVKKGGYLILEGFEKKHVENQLQNPKAGGPKDVDMLFSLEDFKNDFEDFDFIEISEIIDELSEGDFHVGRSNLVRIFAVKK